MKKIFALCLILLLLVPGQVFAHSKLTESTPKNNDTLTASPDIISMAFNTDIASLSTFTLENELGEIIAVEQISVEGAVLSGIPSLPLSNSNYTVKWTIIGADGHTIEGDFGFKVNAEENVPSATPEQPIETPAPEVTVSPSPIVVDENNLDAGLSEQSSSSNIVLPIAIIAIIIALAVIFATKRTKKQ